MTTTHEVDDSFRTIPTPSGDAPMACCPHDGEPLVMTLEFRGAEFICVPCDRLFGWLAPVPKPWTQAIQDRHDELLAQYQVARAARKAAGREGIRS